MRRYAHGRGPGRSGAASEIAVRWNGELRVLRLEGTTAELEIEPGGAGESLEAEATVYYCDEGREGLCYFGARKVRVEVIANPAAAGEPTLTLRIGPEA